MHDPIGMAFLWIAQALLTYGVVRWDRGRLTQDQRDRGWNEATTGVAIVWFAPLCLIAHYWVTRRSVWGILRGLAATVLTIVAVELLAQGMIWVGLMKDG